jgi:hypothetical protein
MRMPDGTVAHLKFSGKRPAPCRWCLAIHTLLCDHPRPDGGTCSAPMCSLHAKTVGADRHLCPDHSRDVPAQQALGL